MRAPVFLAALALLGCTSGGGSMTPEPLELPKAEEAQLAARGLMPDLKAVTFVCGASKGHSILAKDLAKGSQEDGMAGGRFVFVTRADGRPDVIFKDATESWASAVAGGGEVRKLSGNVWVIAFANESVVETHNITKVDDGLVDLWTANKASSSLGASARVFVASCKEA